MVATVYMILAG